MFPDMIIDSSSGVFDLFVLIEKMIKSREHIVEQTTLS